MTDSHSAEFRTGLRGHTRRRDGRCKCGSEYPCSQRKLLKYLLDLRRAANAREVRARLQAKSRLTQVARAIVRERDPDPTGALTRRGGVELER